MQKDRGRRRGSDCSLIVCDSIPEVGLDLPPSKPSPIHNLHEPRLRRLRIGAHRCALVTAPWWRAGAHLDAVLGAFSLSEFDCNDARRVLVEHGHLLELAELRTLCLDVCRELFELNKRANAARLRCLSQKV